MDQLGHGSFPCPGFLLSVSPQERSCVMNIGVGKSFIMLKTSVAFRDPTFAKHLGEFKVSSSTSTDPAANTPIDPAAFRKDASKGEQIFVQ